MSEGQNLFKQPISDASIISRTDTDYYPSDAIPDNSKETIQIEVINKSEVDLIDLNSTEIIMNLRIQNKENNANLATDLKVARYGICNNFGHAMFKQITIQEGDVEMNPSTGTYPYQVDFENVLQYDERDLEGRARLEGYIPDTASAEAMAKTHADDNTNAGLTVRSALFDDGKTVQVIMKPQLGPLAQKRFLLPNTRVVFKIIPNSDDFLLTYANTAATKTYGVYSKAIKLRIRTVKLTPEVATQIYRNLQKRRAMYPTPTPTMTTSLIEGGLRNWEKDNIFSGKVPKLLTFAIVKNSAYNGSRSENPFYYRNLNISEVRLYIDGIPIIQPITTDFANNNYKEAFLQILNATGNKSTLLNENTWPINNIWVVDLTPNGRNALYEYFPARSGNLRIEIQFNAPTAGGAHTIMLYGLMGSVSEIDANNNVYKNW